MFDRLVKAEFQMIFHNHDQYPVREILGDKAEMIVPYPGAGPNFSQVNIPFPCSLRQVGGIHKNLARTNSLLAAFRLNKYLIADILTYLRGDFGHIIPRTTFVKVEDQIDVLALIVKIARWSEVITFKIADTRNDLWRMREHSRFLDEEYLDIPPKWRERADLLKDTVMDPDHPSFNFPHVSNKNPGILAFTENEDKGQRDIQNVMKPGKYLQQFLGEKMTKVYGENVAKALIAQMAAEFGHYSKPEEMQIARTGEEIERVYTNGPSSCMAHATENYKGGIHPMRTLNNSDIAVAYLERKVGGRKEKSVTARALVWPDKKVFSRIYGDAERLKPLLQAEGYKMMTDWGFEGAKVLKIKSKHNSNEIISPYLDNNPWLKEAEDGVHLIVDRDGYILGQNTNGIADLGYDCALCEKKGRTSDRKSLRQSGKDIYVCRPCYDKGTVFCALGGGRFPHEEMVKMANGDLWHRGNFRIYGFTCAFDGKNYAKHSDHDRSRRSGGGRLYVTMEDGLLWHIDNFKVHGKCTAGGRNITLEQWNREEEARLRKELEDAGQLTLDISIEDLRKKVAAKKRRDQRAAKKLRDEEAAKLKATHEVRPLTQDWYTISSSPKPFGKYGE